MNLSWLWPTKCLSSREPWAAVQEGTAARRGQQPGGDTASSGIAIPAEGKPGKSLSTSTGGDCHQCYPSHISSLGWEILEGLGVLSPLHKPLQLSKHKIQMAEGKERKEGSVIQGLEAWEEVWGRLFLSFVRQITNYTKQDVLFPKRFGRNHAILIQKSYLMQLYKERGKGKCKCKHGVLSWSSPWLFPLSESCLSAGNLLWNIKILPTGGSFRLPQCVSRKGKKLWASSEFPLLCAVAIYFTHFYFKGRNTKSKTQNTN